jgi:hypothetical protein
MKQLPNPYYHLDHDVVIMDQNVVKPENSKLPTSLVSSRKFRNPQNKVVLHSKRTINQAVKPKPSKTPIIDEPDTIHWHYDDNLFG